MWHIEDALVGQISLDPQQPSPWYHAKLYEKRHSEEDCIEDEEKVAIPSLGIKLGE